MYRTHESNLDYLSDELRNFCSDTRKEKTYVLIGDINANLISTNKKQKDIILNVLFEAGFIWGVSKPTRVDGNSKTCIDHIFINHHKQEDIKTAVIETEIT